MTKSESDFVLLKTGKLLEADLVANHLEMEGIPFYRRKETSAGIELAMPFQPVQGAGVFWVIWVPRKYAGAARDVMNSLPVETTVNPDVWHYGPAKKVRRFVIFCAWATLILTLLLAAAWLIQDIGTL